MSQNDSDSTCVASILDHFKRKASPNRLAVEDRTDRNRPVATKLDFDNEILDTDDNGTAKRKKLSANEMQPVSNNVSQSDHSVLGNLLPNKVILLKSIM